MEANDDWTTWDEARQLAWLDGALAGLEDKVLAAQARVQDRVNRLEPAFRASANNLAGYVAVRQEDLRLLQGRLQAVGLSSLGRSEQHILQALRAVRGVVKALKGEARALTRVEASDTLSDHADALFGPSRGDRRVRIMVTMPSEAASSPELVSSLVEAGMDVMRINVAHDGPEAWKAMARHLRAANEKLGTACLVQLDLAGPKLRTGDFEPGPRALHWSPRRDALGNVLEAARVRLSAPGDDQRAEQALRLPAPWVARLAVGDVVDFSDLRGRRRTLNVIARDRLGAWAHATQSAYVGPETTLSHLARGEKHEARPVELPPQPGSVHLQVGDPVVLTPPGTLGREARDGEPARVSCTLREAYDALRVGHQVWFDDGKLGAVVEALGDDGVALRITHGPPRAARLLADKGINLPDTRLDIAAMGPEDLAALDVAVEVGDLVALSFARRASDVRALHRALEERRSKLKVVLKVENREGFKNLAPMLLAAMERPPFGVMIARGDLAVEVGFARLAEVQEEMLWLCEAAHVPIIWATQVLETAARKGAPSRAEVTDAAQGVRAECVMLNKGPHIRDAIRTLDDILRRMAGHQQKKTALFRRLESVGLDE